MNHSLNSSSHLNNWLGLDWQLSLSSGWGIAGLNMSHEMEVDGRFRPVPLYPSAQLDHASEKFTSLVEKLKRREVEVAKGLRVSQRPQAFGSQGVLGSLGFKLALGLWVPTRPGAFGDRRLRDALGSKGSGSLCTPKVPGLWEPKALGHFAFQMPWVPLGAKCPRTLWEPTAQGCFWIQRPWATLDPKG